MQHLLINGEIKPGTPDAAPLRPFIVGPFKDSEQSATWAETLRQHLPATRVEYMSFNLPVGHPPAAAQVASAINNLGNAGLEQFPTGFEVIAERTAAGVTHES